MNKIMILGLLIVIENTDDKQSETVPARRVPTLDDLFADAFNIDKRERDEEERRKKYGTIFS